MMSSTQTDTRTEIRLAGEGGQGMILAGIILAEAAAIYDGKCVIQSQSYGPEARGGASKAEIIISDDPIDFPEVLQADILIALSQEACDKYVGDLKEDSQLVVDSDNVRDVPRKEAVQLPITTTALEITGRAITANTVALGILTALTGIVSEEAISKAVAARAPKGTKEINLKALEAGFKAGRAFRRA